jgi:hypothetical protein
MLLLHWYLSQLRLEAVTPEGSLKAVKLLHDATPVNCMGTST